MLLLSLLTLFAGPLLFQWLSSSHPLAQTLDRVIVGVLIVLVVVLFIAEFFYRRLRFPYFQQPGFRRYLQIVFDSGLRRA